MPPRDYEECRGDNDIARKALDIAIRTIQRAFSCERQTSTPRSACWCVEVDRQGVHYTKIDPSSMCMPCQAVWHAQASAMLMCTIDNDDYERYRQENGDAP